MFRLFANQKLPRWVRKHVQTGHQHWIAGHFASAEEAYRKAARTANNHPFPHLCLGQLYAAAERDEQAIKELSTALVFGIESPTHWAETEQWAQDQSLGATINADCDGCRLAEWVRCRVGCLCWRQKRYRAAAEQFTAAAKANSSCVTALLGMAAIVIERQQPKVALSFLSRAERVTPPCDQVFYLKGLALLMQGLSDQAQTEFHRALELNPDHLGALFQLAVCYQSMGEFLRAVNTADCALAKSPESIDLLSLKAQCFECLVHLSGVADGKEFFVRSAAECRQRINALKIT